MYKSFISNKVEDNAESSDTFINKAVLTVGYFYVNASFYDVDFLETWRTQ